MGSGNAVTGFTVEEGHSASIDVTVTGRSLLSAISDLNVAVQRWDASSETWVTVADSSSDPSLISIIGGDSVSLTLDGLEPGQYRVTAFSDNALLGLLSTTTVAVDVTDTGPGVSGTANGNLITDDDGVHGSDSVTPGTLVSQVTNSDGTVVEVPASGEGVTIDGEYGSLTLFADGSWTYTLLDSSTSVQGKTETFTYTLSDGTQSSSANLTIALTPPGGSDEVVTAVDDRVTLDVETVYQETDNGESSKTGFVLLNLGLGDILDLSLIDINNQATFSVGADEVRNLNLQANAGGIAIGTSFDLYIYKYDEQSGQYQVMQRVEDWYRIVLLGGVSDELPITLTEGNYLFLLNATSGLSVATGYTLKVLSDVTHSVSTDNVSVTGNVVSEGDGADTVPEGSVISSVNGVTIASDGTTTIAGLYGELTIDNQGNYTYTLYGGQEAANVGASERFSYTVTGPQGTQSTATLTVNLTQPQLTAVDDTVALEVAAANVSTAFSQVNLASADWTTGSSSVTQNAQGAFHVDEGHVLTGISLQYALDDSLLLGSVGLTISYTITNAAGEVVASSSAPLVTNSNASPDAISLGSLVLAGGDYVLHVTSISDAAGTVISRPTVSVDASLSGTEITLDEFHTGEAVTVTGNILDGSDADGAADETLDINTQLIVSNDQQSVTLNQYDEQPATLAGKYGTLTIYGDGHYSYSLNGDVDVTSITQKETFDYQLKTADNASASATLTVDLHPMLSGSSQGDTVTSTAYDDTYTLGAGADTVIFNLLDAQDSTGGNGSDNVWSDFSTADGDGVDVTGLLTDWDGSSDTFGQYLSVEHTEDGNTVISIDRDGSGSQYQSTELITLEGVEVTLDELLQHNSQDNV